MEIGDDLYVKFLVKQLDPGKEETVSFTVNVTGEGYARIDNTAQVKSVQEDPENHFMDEDFAETNTVVHYIPYVVIPEEPEESTGNPTLKIEKTSDKKVYKVGETGHYKVVTTQVKEDMVAKNLVLKDDLQTKGAKILTDTIRIANPAGKDITKEVKKITAKETGYQIDTGMDLFYGQSFTVTYDVLFEAESLDGKQVINIAKSKADNASAETENDVTPVLIEEGLTALKTSDPKSGTVVKAGQEITYTILLSNTGKEDKKNVYMMDAVPDHTEYVKDSAVFTVDSDQVASDKKEEETTKDAEGSSEEKKEGTKEDSTTEVAPAGTESEDKPTEGTIEAVETKDSDAETSTVASSETSSTEQSETVATETTTDQSVEETTKAAESTTETVSTEDSVEAATENTETASPAETTTEVTPVVAEEGTTDDTDGGTEEATTDKEKTAEDRTDAKDADDAAGKSSEEDASVSDKGEIRTIDGKDYVTWIIPVIPAGKAASVSFKVKVSSDAKESDLIENVALVKAYGDKVPDDPWIPENYVPTNRTIHPLNLWTETTHTVDVEKEAAKKEPEKKEPEKDTETPTTEKKTETKKKTTTSTPKSGGGAKDDGTSGPKGGVQTGVHSNELLYAGIAAGLALLAIIVRRSRKHKRY